MKHHILAGSYAPDGNDTLRLFEIEGDRITQLQANAAIANTSHQSRSNNGLWYAVTEKDASTSRLSAMRHRPGQLPQPVKSIPTHSWGPCWSAVTPDGTHIATADYGDGTVSIWTLDHDGLPCGQPRRLRFEGHGPVPRRQQTPHPHCITFTPDNTLMVVTDLGTDSIHAFDARTFTHAWTMKTTPGTGPRLIAWHPDNRHAYLINELADTVQVLRYTSPAQPFDILQTLTLPGAGGQGAGDLKLSPDGTSLYASLRLANDGVAIYDIDPDTALLTPAGRISTGRHPRSILPLDDNSLLVAARDDNRLELYNSQGTLVTTAPCPGAVCLNIL